MTVTVSWEAVIAICASLTMFGAGFVWLARVIMRLEFADFLVLLSGTFVRQAVFVEHQTDVERRLTHLEAKN